MPFSQTYPTGNLKAIFTINILLLLFFPPLFNQEADIIFYNGSIVTMEENFVPAEALAVTDGKILSYGSLDEIIKTQSSSTNMIDLKGRTILPGIVDPHNHFFTDAAQVLDSTLTMEDRQNLLLAQGITTMGDPNTEAWSYPPIQNFEKTGNMKIKTNVYIIRNHACNWDVDLDYESYPLTQDKNARLRIAGIKIFTDGGSCGTRPATTFEYPDGGNGDLFLNDDQLETWINEADDKGYQIVIHSQGDRAIAQAQKKLAMVIEDRKNPLRHRIDHNAFLNSDLISKYNDIGIPVACFAWFPTCLATESTFLQDTYGEENLRNLEDWRMLLDANPDIAIAWHSDGPLLEYRLPQNIHSYVTRAEVKESGDTCEPPAWLADHKITIKEVLKMMTIDAAYILHRDHQVGSLKQGKSADLVVLSDNPLSIPSDELINLQVLMTMVDGEVVYCQPDYESECNLVITPTDQPIEHKYHLGNPIPNPVKSLNIFNISLDIAYSVDVQYVLYDSRGKVLFRSISETYDEGSHVIDLNSNGIIGHGLYYIKFRIGNDIQVKKIIVL